jgi:hypothetical protein
MTSEKKLSPLRQKDIRQGAQQERERIIALLEAWVADDYGDFDKTLALIKGENK